MTFFSKPISLGLFVLCISLLCSGVIGADPLYHICFSPERFGPSSPYKSARNNLLSFLSSKVPPTGFETASSVADVKLLYGLGLCRGDVGSEDCKSCVIGAGQELRLQCPHSKGAIVWYNYCLVKYSDDEFFGKIDNKNKFYLRNVADVDMDFKEFYQEINDLLGGLAEQAAGSFERYASGDKKLSESSRQTLFGLAQCMRDLSSNDCKSSRQTLFGLAQCTRDLSSIDCKSCLEQAISELPSCCYGKRGGRTVGGSCNVRYELYPFVNS